MRYQENASSDWVELDRASDYHNQMPSAWRMLCGHYIENLFAFTHVETHDLADGINVYVGTANADVHILWDWRTDSSAAIGLANVGHYCDFRAVLGDLGYAPEHEVVQTAIKHLQTMIDAARTGAGLNNN